MDEQTKMIKVSQIQVGKHEQRLEEDPAVFAELVNSIGRLGLLIPLIVALDGQNYILVAGHRRLAAVKKLGYAEARCIIRQSTDTLDAEVTFAENFCRKALTPIEQACAIGDCYKNKTMSIEQMAKAFHRSENWIASQMAMIDWPKDVLDAIHFEQISVSAAANLAQISDDAYRGFLLETAVTSGATARSTSAWLQGWRSSQSPEEAVQLVPDQTAPPQLPLCPQLPCICCETVLRMDQMSHVPVCQNCIQVIRNAPKS